MLEKEGFLSRDELERIPGFPGRESLEKKRLAILECGQQIPCDPCEMVCPNHAITVGDSIINLPSIDAEKCVGCTLCISKCPGLAIFVVDLSHEKYDTIFLPYEYLPLPEKGDKVSCLNRAGEKVTEGFVRSVICRKADDKTAVIQLEVPKNYGMEVRNISTDRDHGCKMEGMEDREVTSLSTIEHSEEDSTIICRCEEVTKGVIVQAIRDGARDIHTVKRMTRAGMGLCQGRNCSRLIMNIISQALNIPIWQIEIPSIRPPVRSVKLDSFISALDNE